MPHALTHHHAVPAPNTAFEATRLNLHAAVAHHTGSTGGSIVRTILALLIVVAVIYGLTWVIRRLKGAETGPGSGQGLERVASLTLGQNRSVALVRVGTEVHLLGLGESSVTGIARFSEDEALELGLPIDIVPPGAERPVPAPSFRDPEGRPSFSATLDSLKRMTQR